MTGSGDSLRSTEEEEEGGEGYMRAYIYVCVCAPARDSGWESSKITEWASFALAAALSALVALLTRLTGGNGISCTLRAGRVGGSQADR